MSNSNDPFSDPTTVAQGKKPPKSSNGRRATAHTVRRDEVGKAEPRGVAHVIRRDSMAEDSAGASTLALGKGRSAPAVYSEDEFTVEEPRPQPVGAAAPNVDVQQGFLFVREGKDAGRRVGLMEGRTSIGRGMDNDVVLSDIAVSRKHVYVERRDNIYFLCDLSSGNGTFVNERERQGEVLIVNGDSFRIGNTVIVFEGPEAQEDLSATAGWQGNYVDDDDDERTVAGKGQDRPLDTDSGQVTKLPTSIVAPSQSSPSPQNYPVAHRDAAPSSVHIAPEAHLQAPVNRAEEAALAAVDSIIMTPPPQDSPSRGAVPTPTGPTRLPSEPSEILDIADLESIPPESLMSASGENSIPVPLSSAPSQPVRASIPQPSAPVPAPMGQLPSSPMHRGNPMQGAPIASNPMNTGPQPLPQNLHSHSGGIPVPGHSANSMMGGMMAGASPNVSQHSYGIRPKKKKRGKGMLVLVGIAVLLVGIGIVAAVIGQSDSSKAKKEELAKTQPSVGEEQGVAAKAETAILPESLVAGNTKLPSSVWGNDESFLTDSGKSGGTEEATGSENSEAEEAAAKEAAAKEAAAKAAEEKAAAEAKAAAELAEMKAAEAKAAEAKAAELAAKKAAELAAKKAAASKPKTTARNTKKNTKPPKNNSARPTKSNTGAAESAAKAAYKRRDFDGAANKLESAADRIDDDDEAEELLDKASLYRQVGKALDDADDDRSSNPARALSAYKKALSKDKRVGSVHASYIRNQIAQVAAKAARSLMARGKLADAKKAADDASRYGERDSVESVYSSLERKASSLVKKAKKAARRGDEDEAKDMLKEAIRIAPKGTDAAEDARDELRDL